MITGRIDTTGHKEAVKRSQARNCTQKLLLYLEALPYDSDIALAKEKANEIMDVLTEYREADD